MSGQGRCKRRVEVIVKMQKKISGGRGVSAGDGGLGRVDVKEELKLL